LTFRGYSTTPEIIGRKANGTIASPTAVSLNSDLLNIKGNGYNGSSYKTGAGIRFESSNTWASTSTPGRIVFSTQPFNGTDALLDRMTIEENGNVGIGFPATGSKLTVGGQILALGDIITNGANIAIGGKISLETEQNYMPAHSTDYGLSSDKSIMRFYGGGTTDVLGIQSGNDGQLLYLYVLSSTELILHHNNNAEGLTGKPIITNTGSDITITGGGATLIYDGISECWRVIGYAD
jgi:hypothetical protein